MSFIFDDLQMLEQELATTPTAPYVPKFLKHWELPHDYFGAEWPDYFVFLGQHRDSDTMARSNFRCGLKALGGEQDGKGPDYEPAVIVVRESHWAVGWVEWIGIRKDAFEALRLADLITRKLDAYPVVDEDAWGELEQEEADTVWKDCFTSPHARAEYVREHRDEFEFHGLRDAIQCLRGDFFGGYAGELLN